jgi:hypothetical protein
MHSSQESIDSLQMKVNQMKVDTLQGLELGQSLARISYEKISYDSNC